MPDPILLRIHDPDRPPFELPLAGPLELGRQRSGEPEPFALLPAEAGRPARVVIARQQESNCSRQHILLEPVSAKLVRVTNRSQIPCACESAKDRLGNLYLALAEIWSKKGQPQQAIQCLQRLVQSPPGSRHAEIAQVRLASLQRRPTVQAEFKKED